MFQEIKGLKRRLDGKDRDKAHCHRKEKVMKEKEHEEQMEAEIRHKFIIEEIKKDEDT